MVENDSRLGRNGGDDYMGVSYEVILVDERLKIKERE